MLITIMRYLLLLFMLLPLELNAREQPYIIVLGVAQDGGYPHMGCTKDCCQAAHKINTPGSSYFFIPDIDSWDHMNKDIISLVESTDIAFLDGTFYSGDELPGRNMDEIPHPCIVETMDLFSRERKETKDKIHFIHFNHSNPVLYNKEIREEILNRGFNIAEQGHNY